MIGIDVSNYQRGLDLTKAECDFVIIKATEGVGFTDRSCGDFIAKSTKLGKLVGLYHYARPDKRPTITGMESEADSFCKTVDYYGMVGKAILVLDWEEKPFDREDLICAWLNRVKENTGVTPFVYGSRSKLTTTAFKNVTRDFPVWMAVWPSIKEVKIEDGKNFAEERIPSRAKIPWVIWQFSAKGKWPGFNGYVDLDYTDMTVSNWFKFCEIDSARPEEEIITPDMQWAIDNGLFVGYPDGRYGPKDFLTREQAASLFRRYSDILKQTTK